MKKNLSLAIFKHRDFRFFIVARFFMVLAINIQATIVGWQVYELTGSVLDLGLVGLFEAVPSIVVSLYAGHLADLRDRRNIIVICLFFLFLCSLTLYAFTGPLGFLLLKYKAFPIFLVILVSGIARGFISPAIFSFVTQLVPREHYPHSAAWMGTSFQAGAVIGPALGGIVYGSFGMQAAYALDSFCIGLPFLLFFWIAKRSLPERKEKEALKDSLLKGLRFVLKNEIMLGAMALDMFAVLFGGAVALLPVYAKDILFVGSEGLGYLRAAPSLGALLMAYYLTYKPPLEKSGRVLLLCVFGFGLCMLVFGLSESSLLSLFALFLSGVFDSVSVVVRSTIMQTMTPEEMRGRVSAINKVFIGSSNEIGAFESGLSAKILGPVGSVVFGATMTLLIVFFTFRFSPKLKDLELKNWV
ncbi:MFS transporter [Leptospira sp. 2 VSF19]|uniref:Multidrug efflux pump Tap n=1 Tax=Leptospira soteropolitanensis TaxID=2950025 RepID=A0AAW5VHW8_9LEPT|nr:MFS transporter [Leptospira soteropolitanensis]MCW7493116.1 MFS transporter [Leptospira soteropolitanensis]MCW7500815.1 MFS transporter [Leptospira soteropolitanensis]MCW7522966.1 MFS transporter [Leptospira soteropolitanensis]MCW7526927.1 MFS transporter [Leptospira soteropolitanensis]MCW7530684.1 MFS transporter [Leptospira soteropolitanensis]